MAAAEARARVGTAGWTIPPGLAAAFPGAGPHLARYSSRLPVAEINSSFHRPHAPAVYARWAATVGPSFRFATKVPKEVTHARRLVGAEDVLARFLDERAALGPKAGPLLVQLPPSLSFDAGVAERFFVGLAGRHDGRVVCEPRHPSWFEEDADALLRRCEVARVAADPAPVPAAARPGGWPGLVYRRLHGSPVTYRSPYAEATLDELARVIAGEVAAGVPSWCIFDNTASGAALGNAIGLATRLRRPG